MEEGSGVTADEVRCASSSFSICSGEVPLNLEISHRCSMYVLVPRSRPRVGKHLPGSSLHTVSVWVGV